MSDRHVTTDGGRDVRLLLALVFALLAAQTISFAPQPFSRVPGLSEYRVYVAAPEGQPMQVYGMRVMLEGAKQNIRIYSYRNLQAYIAYYNQRSLLRWLGIGMEAAGWTLTSLQAGDVVKIKERWKAAVPAASGVLTLARTYYDREYKQVLVPSDLMQPLMAVPAGQVIDFAVWAQ